MKKELKIKEIIEAEKLKENSKRFIKKVTEKRYATSMETELDNFLSPTSRRQGAREAKNKRFYKEFKKLWKPLWKFRK